MGNGKVYWLNAFGTISFKKPKKEGAPLGNPSTFYEMIRQDPYLEGEYQAGRLEGEDVKELHYRPDSGEWGIKERLILEKQVREKEKEGYNIVVSQGSDTLQETVHQLVQRRMLNKKRIIVVGARHPYWHKDTKDIMRTAYLAAQDHRLMGINSVSDKVVLRGSRTEKIGGDDIYFTSHKASEIAEYSPSENKLVYDWPRVMAQWDFSNLFKQWYTELTGLDAKKSQIRESLSPSDALLEVMESIEELPDHPIYFNPLDRLFRTLVQRTTNFDIHIGMTPDELYNMFIEKDGGIIGVYGSSGIPPELRAAIGELSGEKLIAFASKTPEAAADFVGYKAGLRATMKKPVVPLLDAQRDFMQLKMAQIFANMLVTGRDYRNDDNAMEMARQLLLKNMNDEISTDEFSTRSKKYIPVVKRFGLEISYEDAAKILLEAERVFSDNSLISYQRRLANSFRPLRSPIQDAAALRTLATKVEKDNKLIPSYLSNGLVEATRQVSRQSAQERKSSIPRGTAFVIEDDDALRQMYTVQLESIGYTVLAASRAEDVFEGSNERMDWKERPDFILCDYDLPGMKGDEFIKKANEIDADVTKILISAYALDKLDNLPENVKVMKKGDDIEKEVI